MQTIQELSVVGRSLNARPALRAVHGGDEEQAPLAPKPIMRGILLYWQRRWPYTESAWTFRASGVVHRVGSTKLSLPR